MALCKTFLWFQAPSTPYQIAFSFHYESYCFESVFATLDCFSYLIQEVFNCFSTLHGNAASTSQKNLAKRGRFPHSYSVTYYFYKKLAGNEKSLKFSLIEQSILRVSRVFPRISASLGGLLCFREYFKYRFINHKTVQKLLKYPE